MTPPERLQDVIAEMREWAHGEGCFNDDPEGEPLLCVYYSQQAFLSLCDRIEAAALSVRGDGKGPLPTGAIAWLDMGKGEASLTFSKRTDSNRTHKKHVMAMFASLPPGYHALYLHATPPSEG